MATTNNNASAAFTELLAIAHTGAKGYQEAAEGASNPQIKSELSQLSQQRAQFESQLQQQASPAICPSRMRHLSRPAE
jgi:hypothetical protein